MKFFKNISLWYFLGLLIWLVIISLRSAGVIVPLVNNYLTDLYTIPMYCYTIETLMNRMFGYEWKSDFKFIISSSLFISILFEFICPLISPSYTSDIIDVLCYFTGGILFYYYRQYSLKKSSLN